MPTCIIGECNENAKYGLFKDRKKLYCKNHKNEEEFMVDLTRNLCKECGTRASFGYLGRKPESCKEHMKDDMIDLVHDKCKHVNKEGKKCGKRANFGNSGGRPEYCKEHMTDIMIDVTHDKCKCKHKDKEGKKCETRASFGNPGGKSEYCKEHKKDNMIDLIHNICEHKGCKNRPIFNLPGEKAGKYCLEHKESNMVDVHHKMCVLCNITRADPKYKNHCVRCFVYKFPDHKNSMNYKTKEKHVLDALQAKLKDHKIEITSRDKPIGGCSKRRPDLFCDLLTHCIIVENDENEHKDYDNLCENKRICELSQDLAHRPLIIIRFNCDHYILDGKKHDSLFKITRSTGLPVIRSQKKFDERIDVLYNTFMKYTEDPPEKLIIVEYLFYSNSN
jgi:hypothetical protein